MLRFVRKNGLIPALNLKDFAAFARKYNGPAYAANRYDVRMAAAYQKWAAKLDSTAIPPPAPETPETELPVPEKIDELPPPYIEPKTPEKSKTLWSVLMQIFSVIGGGIGYAFSDWRIMLAMAALIVFFALFIGRERLRRIWDEVA